MADNEDSIRQFMGITGVDEERARFYLESSAGELEVRSCPLSGPPRSHCVAFQLAVARFYENDGDEDVVEQPQPQRVEEMSSSADAEAPKPRPKPTSRFATLGSLNRSSDDEEEGQAFYAGGSEHSGQQVLGPSKKKDIVADMFKSVQE